MTSARCQPLGYAVLWQYSFYDVKTIHKFSESYSLFICFMTFSGSKYEFLGRKKFILSSFSIILSRHLSLVFLLEINGRLFVTFVFHLFFYFLRLGSFSFWSKNNKRDFHQAFAHFRKKFILSTWIIIWFRSCLTESLCKVCTSVKGIYAGHKSC